MRPLLSTSGRAHVNRGAGLLQVTDFPERVDAVGRYLDRVVLRAGRQIRIEARIIEVALADTSSAGLDWVALSRLTPALLGIDGTSIRPVLTTRADVDRFLEALEQQGVVNLALALQAGAIRWRPGASWSMRCRSMLGMRPPTTIWPGCSSLAATRHAPSRTIGGSSNTPPPSMPSLSRS